jgi:glycosyltransferase involved in cell wall biosynthesis
MERIPLSPPKILPLSAGIIRPEWSVKIPVFNCSQFLLEALLSVLKDALPETEMEIEVIDDASTDADIFTLIETIGNGRIKYFRQEQNVGSLRNFETCINRSTGKLIHILHGDDKVKPGYYKKITELFNQFPNAGAAFCRYSYINDRSEFLYYEKSEATDDGILKNWQERIAIRNTVQYCAITVKREVYEKHGAFYGITYGEDWEMWVRIAKFYPFAYTTTILAEYRKHGNSITGQKFLNGDYVDDIVAAMQRIQILLPEDKQEAVLNSSKRFYSHYALKTAMEVWKSTKNKTYVKANIRQALKLYRDRQIMWKVFKTYVKMLIKKY